MTPVRWFAVGLALTVAACDESPLKSKTPESPAPLVQGVQVSAPFGKVELALQVFA